MACEEVLFQNDECLRHVVKQFNDFLGPLSFLYEVNILNFFSFDEILFFPIELQEKSFYVILCLWNFYRSVIIALIFIFASIIDVVNPKDALGRDDHDHDVDYFKLPSVILCKYVVKIKKLVSQRHYSKDLLEIPIWL